MRQKRLQRLFMSVTLLVTLLFFMVVKISHYHKREVPVACCCMESCSDSNSDEAPAVPDSEKNCGICHFTLSPFIGSTPLFLEYIASVSFFVDSIEPIGKQISVSHPYHLRAPPVNDFII